MSLGRILLIWLVFMVWVSISLKVFSIIAPVASPIVFMAAFIGWVSLSGALPVWYVIGRK